MPFIKNMLGETTTYTVTTSTWFCQWILNKGLPITRRCHLNDENDTFNLENPEDLHKIHDVLPELLNEVELAIDTWSKEGDSFAPHLLSSENTPAYVEYAKRTFR